MTSLYQIVLILYEEIEADGKMIRKNLPPSSLFLFVSKLVNVYLHFLFLYKGMQLQKAWKSFGQVCQVEASR